MDRRKLVRASPAVAKSIVSGTVLFLVYEEALPSSPCRSGPTTRGRLYTLGSVAAAGAAAGLSHGACEILWDKTALAIKARWGGGNRWPERKFNIVSSLSFQAVSHCSLFVSYEVCPPGKTSKKQCAYTHTHGYTRTHNTNYSECACRASKWQVHCVCGDQHMGSVGVWTSRAKFSTSESWRVLALLLAWCKRRYRRPLLLFSLPFLSAVPHCSCKDACK